MRMEEENDIDTVEQEGQVELERIDCIDCTNQQSRHS